MYCRQCGNVLNEKNDKFCMNCGCPIEEEQVKSVQVQNNKKQIKILYYASEVLSVVWHILFLLDLFTGNIEAAAINFFYLLGILNVHKIMITKMLLDNQVINKLSIVIEKIWGFYWNLWKEPTYIYERGKKRNIKINIVIFIICMVIGTLQIL